MLSQDLGAPISSSGSDDTPSGPGAQLIEFVRQGHSFSGRERNCVYLNLGGGEFADVSGVSGIDFPDDARAVGRVDWDLDGDVDLWVSNRNGPQVRVLRNDIHRANDNLCLLLRGTESNRDAVGARVTLIGENDRRMQAVNAGDGYLTQSSKWLIFANSPDRARIVVRWPNGKDEAFPLSASTTKRFLVVEGSGQLTPWLPPERVATPPHVTATRRPASVGASQSVSVVGLPVPRLPMNSMEADGSPSNADESEGPLLLTLWASWCPNCMDELSAWNRQFDELKDAGINILAASVDEIDSNDSTRSDALAAVKRLKLKFPVAIATPESVERLQLVHDYLFSLKQPLPLPVSFLLDAEHRVLAIYKGPVAPGRVRNDLKLQDATYATKRDATTPFKGRWAGKPRTLTLGPFVLDLIGSGAVVEASEYVQDHQIRFSKTELLSLVVRLGMEHLKAGSMTLATRHFDMARKIEPKTVGPEIQQGKHFESLGEYQSARQQYKAALQRNRNSLQALNNLAWLLTTSPDASIRDDARAVTIATAAAKATKYRHPGILDTLATCLANQDRWDEAIDLAIRAESLARGQKMFKLANEIANRKSLFAAKRKYRQ